MAYDDSKIEWIVYDNLAKFPELVQGTFLRDGGISEGPFSKLNLGDGVGDHPDHVKVNRDSARKRLCIGRLVFLNQVHGNKVVRITADNSEKIFNADAMYTTDKNLGLVITHADCQAALFYDPVNEVIAAAHAGWKGLCSNVYGALVETLKNEVGTQPKDLIAAIAPSLDVDHAEFKNYQLELPEKYFDYQVKPFHFDLWAIAKKQLVEAGVEEKNIELTEISNFSDPDNYYSYRRDKETGRNGTVIGFKE